MSLDPGDSDNLLARAVVYRTLSIAFQPPTAARLDRIDADGGFRVVVGALRHLSDSALDPLALCADRLASLPLSAAAGADAVHWRLFGHTTRGQLCPFETEYGDDNAFHQPQQLADISGYYRAFGLHAGAGLDVRPDHIACECEFMDFLSRKEAVLSVMSGGNSEAHDTLEATRRAARTFLRDHLGRFGCAFGARLAAEDADGYFGVFGHVLLAFLQAECERAGVASGPVDLVVRPPMVDETPMACGTASELIQIQRRP